MNRISEITFKSVKNRGEQREEVLIRGVLRDPVATQLLENTETILRQKTDGYEYPVGLRYSDDTLSLISRKNGKDFEVSSIVLPYSDVSANIDEAESNMDSAYPFLYAKSVIFYDSTGTKVLYAKRNITHGSVITYDGAYPSKESTDSTYYSFIGWSLYKNIVIEDADTNEEATSDPRVINLSDYHVTQDVKLYAVFRAYTRTYLVHYYNYDGSLFGLEYVRYGDDAPNTPHYNRYPEKPSSTQSEYTFSGWSDTPSNTPNINCLRNISGEKNVYACFTESPRMYTVTFKNGNTTVGTSQTQYGFFAVYSGETPVKASTEDYSYEFSGWNRDKNATSANQYALLNIVSNTTVYAMFTEVMRNMTIEIVTYPAKMKYTLGDTIDYTGIAIERILENQSHVSIPINECTFTPSSGTIINSIGSIPVTVSYRGKDIATFTVSSVAGNASIVEYPDKMIYLSGETISYTGLRVTTQSGQTEVDITADCILSPAAGSTISENTQVSVTYENTVIDVFTIVAVPTTGFYFAAVATKT